MSANKGEIVDLSPTEPNREEGSDHEPPHLTEEEAAVWHSMSDGARRQLEEVDRKIRPPAAADRMWQRLLDSAQRVRLGNDLDSVWRARGTLGIWMESRGLCNRFTALTELAYRLDLLSENDYHWLARQSSLAAGAADDSKQGLRWDPLCGTLTLDGALIRKVRIFKSPSHVQRILTAFQNAGWPRTIRNPLQTPHDQQQLHLAVNQLNRKLQRIRFSASGGAEYITWIQVASDVG